MVSQSQSVKRLSSLWKVSSLAVLAYTSFLSPLALLQTPSVAQISAPTSGLAPSFSLGEEYVLGAGDIVKIDMYGQETLFAEPYTVLIDGTISLPFIGRVAVGGSTISQAQAAIAQRYTQFFKRPYVTVVLTKARDIKLNIAGEVLRPGPYPISQTEEPNPTVSSLIKLAGGHTQSADLENVQIRRPRKDGTEEVLVTNILSLIRDGDGSQNILLRDGDTVVIRPAVRSDFATAALLSDNSLTPDQAEPLNVAVVGEVYRPGPYVISGTNSFIDQAGTIGEQNGARSLGQPTLSQAIQRAGGIKPEADIRRIEVRRLTRAGTEQKLEVDLWKLLQDGDLQQDIVLQNNDTVIIPETTALTNAEKIKLTDSTLSPETIKVNIVGEVRQPGEVQIKPNTPLSQAVLAAGGFDNSRANKKSVDLIRLQPDGTVSQRRIRLVDGGPINEETNPALKNNDVVVIRRSGLAKFGDATGNTLGSLTGAFSFLRILGLP